VENFHSKLKYTPLSLNLFDNNELLIQSFLSYVHETLSLISEFKIVKMYIVYLLLFFTITFSAFANTETWPSLFQPFDLIPKDNHQSKILNNIENSSPERIREKIHDSFYFIYDFDSETKFERPLNWINELKEPQKALELGYPQEIKRPINKIHYPIYPLIKLYYFNGDNATNSSINSCQSYWLNEKYQDAYNCLASLQINITTGKYKATSIQKIQVTILQAFFMLNLSLNNNKDVKNIAYKTIPPTLIRFKPNEVFNITTNLFSYLINRYKEEDFENDNNSKSILKDYGDFFKYPQYLVDLKFKKNFKFTVTLGSESVDPLVWIHSVMPIVYLNALSFNENLNNPQKSYMASNKLDTYLDNFDFPKLERGFAMSTPTLSSVGEDIYFNPKNNLDTSVMLDFYRAEAYQKEGEHELALKSISQGILRNGDPELSSLLFKTAADTYYDLNILQFARRAYSWSEMYSKDFSFKVPSVLFYGAESAFWLGQYETAKKAFKQFLLASGDKVYAPIARLRIGNIDQRLGNINAAVSSYESILRNFDNHPASQEAAVNLFCMDVNKDSKNVRKLKYKNMEKKIKYARPDVLRQAKACMLNSDLMDATEKSFEQNDKNVVEKANFQKEIIANYNKEFIDNEFIVLFKDRIRQLELADAALLAWQNKCEDLISYYSKNKLELKKLSKENNKYVAGLKWDKTERNKLLRCAALVNNNKMWKEARAFDVGKEGDPIQEKFYYFSEKPSSKTALNIYYEIKKSAKNWENKIDYVENTGNEITDQEDFWELLATKKFIAYEFTSGKSSKNLLSQAIVKDLLQEPQVIFQLPIFCSWFLRQFNNLSRDDLDRILLMKNSSSWIDLLDSNAKGSQCELAVAKNLLSQSFRISSEKRDKQLLLPYLKKLGFDKASEDWLIYAQRLEEEKGGIDDEVTDIYRNLEKESKDQRVKMAATLWLKKNFPNSADKVLW
jgi:hypothetical protein